VNSISHTAEPSGPTVIVSFRSRQALQPRASAAAAAGSRRLRIGVVMGSSGFQVSAGNDTAPGENVDADGRKKR